jgi:thioesterase domain-containing protein
LRKLASLTPQEQLAYVLERVEGKLKKRLKRIERIIKKIACRLSLGIGGRVPSALRTFYFLEAGGQAAQKYVPHVYSGRVILFQSQNCSPDLQLDWGRLATEGLEVYEVSGGHLDIMREPHVRTLAAELRACLS